MDVLIKSSLLEGQIASISSKSYVHRLMIAAALSKEATDILCPEISDDLLSSSRCLEKIGTKVERTKYGFAIAHSKIEEERILDCGESGATLRFLLPVCCALGLDCTLLRRLTLKKRPIEPLVETLKEHGCNIVSFGEQIRCSGKLKAGEYKIDSGISSQFISGLLLALPLLESDSTIETIGNNVSLPYIDLTISVLNLFGVKIIKRSGGYDIPGKQKYASPGKVVAEGDWSAAAVWLCAGALSKKTIGVSGLDLCSKQGDKAVVDILKAFGADVSEKGGTVSVCKNKLHGIEIDAKDIPDIIPPLCVVASVSDGRTIIKNAAHLKQKESNRLHSITRLISSLGGQISESEDSLIIDGVDHLMGGSVSSFNDHRMIMSAAIASIVSDAPVLVFEAQNIAKSYPDFFLHFETLGGELTIRN